MARLAAITGATGFLGRYIVRAMIAAGWRVRILTRHTPVHPQLADLKFEAVPGNLSDRRALRELVDGADAVIHAAGLIKALSAADFRSVNVGGTVNLITALKENKTATRLLMVSSMAAREPQLSAYAETKRGAEEAVAAMLGHPHDWAIVRPCAIYGPWDRETLAIFRAVSRRIFPLPRIENARIALIHAADAAAAMVSLCDSAYSSAIFELTDEHVEGYSWDEIVSTAEMAIGAKVLAVPLPGMAVLAAAVIGATAARLARRTPMLTLGKAREILHADWGSAPDRRPPPAVWQPKIGLKQGFQDTVSWYRDRLWLPPAVPRPGAADASG